MRGYKEEGTTTTPFDMVVLNDLDRFSLVRDVVDRVPAADGRAAEVRKLVEQIHAEHNTYIREHGEDLPQVKDWTWGFYSR